MSGNDRAARIHKKPLLASIISLFVITIVAVCARLVIRVRYQKTLLIDDGFLLFGIACLIASMAFLFVFVDQMYLLEAFWIGYDEIVIPNDFVSQLLDFQKWACICLILLWSSISAVKFSYLFLFRKLIDRIQWMIIYWWIVTVFCVIVWLYGIAAYILPCPWFYSTRSMECTRGPDIQRAVITSSLQMSLDAVSDFLILFIPVRLIWAIQVRWSQKLALGLTLCLTIVLIAITLIRASGLKYHGVMDSVWEVYWQFISTEVGLILTSLTAFRTLFVAHTVQKGPRPAKWSLDTYKKQLLRQLTRSWTWAQRKSTKGSEASVSSDDNGSHRSEELVEVPKGTMTGLRSFINGRGRSAVGISGILVSRMPEEDEERGAIGEVQDPGQIRVHHEIITSQSVKGNIAPGITSHATGRS